MNILTYYKEWHTFQSAVEKWPTHKRTILANEQHFLWHYIMMFENHRKSRIQNCHKRSNLASFRKPEAYGQTMFPDRSIWKGQKLVKIAEIEKLEWDILSAYQTLWYLRMITYSLVSWQSGLGLMDVPPPPPELHLYNELIFFTSKLLKPFRCPIWHFEKRRLVIVGNPFQLKALSP